MFIELSRTFHQLLARAESQPSNVEILFPTGESLTWHDLLSEFRVVILSEAGSGKTEEIRNTARRLRKEGKAAFFIRLEHVVRDFQSAFEEGTHEEFEDWIASDSEGWLLLDSVDEARLRHPGDFEAAVRSLGVLLRSAKQRVHVVITGRTPAWRPKTDLAMCEKHLAFSISSRSETSETPESGCEYEIREKGPTEAPQVSVFMIVAIDDLSSRQVEIFAKAMGIADSRLFLDAVERADAWPFTSRPLDLEELIDFWKDHGRIGRRLELMKNSIARRLSERDQGRADARPLSSERAYLGAKRVAGACTLAQEPTIRVPDGSSNLNGLPIKTILTDWNDVECATLLARPIFDEAIYGTVRFHHRSVREYLTAEWLSDLLKQETSRRKIEELLFREQYGLEVVVPATRPILPWLAIFDEKIRDRVRRIAPEVLFEGGDPSQLPFETRRRILRQVCDQLASGASGRAMTDRDAVQRFSNVDLAEEIKELLRKFEANDDVLWFLLRMVWQGEIKGALPESMRIALSCNASRHARMAAFRVVSAFGTESEMAALRHGFKCETAPLDRDVLAALLEDSEPTLAILDWLFECLRNAEPKERYRVDDLSWKVGEMVDRADDSILLPFIRRANFLLEEVPVVERRHCEISDKYAWLLSAAGKAVRRLVISQNEAVLEPSCLAVLHKLPIAQQYNLDETGGDTKVDLAAQVAGWSKLNLALFWYLVEHERKWIDHAKHERLTDWWSASIWSSYVQFVPSDFPLVLRDVVTRSLPDDKLVALSLAFKLYSDSGRQPVLRNQLKKAVLGDVTLSSRLAELLRPPRRSAESAKYKRMEADWKRKSEKAKLTKQENRNNWREYITKNIERLREPRLERPDDISRAQHYLHEEMRTASHGSSTWTEGKWQFLVGEFGPDVARAFRDGAVAYWRRYKPKLISEGAPGNSIDFSTIFGLTGLAIEARELAGWPNALNEAEAELAFRYAMRELNGFPPWLPRLFAKYPDVITRLSLHEIEYELATETEEVESHYLLSDLAFSGEWFWQSIGQKLCEAVASNEPNNLSNLDHILNVIQGSTSVSDERIARIASEKTVSLGRSDHVARWFAVWSGVEPDGAIAALKARLDSIANDEERKLFAVIYVTVLLGGRRHSGSRVREAYRTAHHLKVLYLLMHQYIRRVDDTDRTKGGVYSPSIRDDAQEAREQLFSLLKEIPGKEAFLAIDEISRLHPNERSRPWFQLQAKTKAEHDADSLPWTPSQVREFAEDHERTPTNHRDLFDLAAMRLRDLKDDLETGDSSVASMLQKVDDEIEMRKYIGNWCRQCSRGRYSIPQEEELADAKRPDLRWHGVGFDAPVPIELKLADNWTGPQLFERLKVQLCDDYLRDTRSRRGIYLLVYLGKKTSWDLPNSKDSADFSGLTSALMEHWSQIAGSFPGIDEILVIGIDLTKRSRAPRLVI
ncbi:MAG: hypothetical protein HZC22_18125 [Rhodocyclales bacterium]|nr:hypothetical protein [Rhodocyclales bacterium]